MAAKPATQNTHKIKTTKTQNCLSSNKNLELTNHASRNTNIGGKEAEIGTGG
jgi:hypothetical protein